MRFSPPQILLSIFTKFQQIPFWSLRQTRGLALSILTMGHFWSSWDWGAHTSFSSSSPSSYFTSLVSLCFIFLRSFFPCFEYSFKSSLLTCSKKSKKRMKGLEGWTKKEKQEFWGSSTFNLSSLSVDGQKWMDILERLTGGKKLLGGERVLERFQEKRHCWRKEPISTSSFFL